MFGYNVLLTAEEAKPVIANIVKEYFDHADTDDVADSALELNISNLFTEIFSTSLQKKQYTLLSTLAQTPI